MAALVQTKRLINSSIGKRQVMALVEGKLAKKEVKPGEAFETTPEQAALLMRYSDIKDLASMVPEIDTLAALKKQVADLTAENAALKAPATKTASLLGGK